MLLVRAQSVPLKSPPKSTNYALATSSWLDENILKTTTLSDMTLEVELQTLQLSRNCKDDQRVKHIRTGYVLMSRSHSESEDARQLSLSVQHLLCVDEEIGYV